MTAGTDLSSDAQDRVARDDKDLVEEAATNLCNFRKFDYLLTPPTFIQLTLFPYQRSTLRHLT